MKKIVASVGLAAIGASGLQAATLPGGDASKPWRISATLRGFYDDNINTLPDGSPNKVDSFGFEISPSASLSWAPEQTSINATYAYSLRYYVRKPSGNTDHYDQTHTFNFLLSHSFNPRYHLDVSDSFVIGQEPDTLRTGAAFTTFQRIPGDNIRNYGYIDFSAQMTTLLGFKFGYANTFYDYADAHGNAAFPSRSGLLDRLEHTLHLDATWLVQPQTTAVVGYQFKQVNYTAGEEIAINGSGVSIFSENRDNREHYAYIGADHTFRPDLTGSVKVGGRYLDFYKDPTGNGNGFGPYAMGSLHWTYAPESYLEAGVSHDMNTTDTISVIGDSFTQDEESTVVFVTLNHRITPNLVGNITGQFQDSTFNGGAINGLSERYFLIGLNLEYRFNPHLSAHVGYNYDIVDSDVSSRSFARNRVYMGVTASY